MADGQVKDKYAFIIDDCLYSSSQEELLSHSKFAREDEILSDDELPSSSAVVDSRRNFNAGDEVENKTGGEVVDGEASNARDENLGFQGERKRVNCEDEREFESQLKKTRVSQMVHCSGKAAIEVEIGSSLRLPAGVVRGDSDCTQKLDSEGFEEDVREDSDVMKKKVEVFTDTEVVNLEDGEEMEGGRSRQKGNVDKEEGEARGGGSGKVEDDVEEKRQLPPSLFGVYWCNGSEDRNRNRDLEEIRGDGNGSGNKSAELGGDSKEISGDGNGNGNRDLEGSLKEISGDGDGNGNENGDKNGELEGGKNEKRDGEFKGSKDDAFKCILGELREDYSDDETEVDLLETCKRLGIIFPRSRFLPELEDD